MFTNLDDVNLSSRTIPSISAIERFLNTSGGTIDDETGLVIEKPSPPCMIKNTNMVIDFSQMVAKKQEKSKWNTTPRYIADLKQRRAVKSKKLKTLWSVLDALSIQTGLEIKLTVYDPEPTVAASRRRTEYYSPNICGGNQQPGCI